MNDHPLPDPGRPLRKDAARNRVLLINAAREVFAARGFEASMDDIAHHAGLGVGTAYRHFANKYELANAIFDSAVEAFVDSAEAGSHETDSWDALVGVVEQIQIIAEPLARAEQVVARHPEVLALDANVELEGMVARFLRRKGDLTFRAGFEAAQERIAHRARWTPNAGGTSGDEGVACVRAASASLPGAPWS